MVAQQPNFTRLFYDNLRERLGVFTPLIQILCGPRQVGKTTAVKLFASTHPGECTYINFDGPSPLSVEQLRLDWEKAVALPGKRIIIFDEIQNVPNWAPLIKELYDRERNKRRVNVVILGSSALELLLRGEESLLGRFEIIRATHWNAHEMRACFGWSLEQFLQFGGYPIIGELLHDQSTKSVERIQSFIRDAIIEPVITRDILSLRSIENMSLLRQVLRIVLSLPCEEISFAKLSGQLSEKGSSVTIKSYLELLEKAFLVRLLYRFSKGKIRKRTSSPKIIPLAPALIHAFLSPALVSADAAWFGKVFEAAVIARLAECFTDMYYWSNSREDVDVVIEYDSIACAIEIKSGRDLDWKGLSAFKKEYPKAQTLMIDRVLGESLLLSKDPKAEIYRLIDQQNRR